MVPQPGNRGWNYGLNTARQNLLNYEPLALASLWASMDSVTDPIWLTLRRRQLQAFLSTAIWILFGLVTVRSSPTIWMSVSELSLVQPAQSSWSKASSIETTGASLMNFLYNSPRASEVIPM